MLRLFTNANLWYILDAMKTKKVPTESQEQQRLVLKLNWQHPDLVFFAIPNGGRRSKGEAIKMRLEGVKAGVPDIFISEPIGSYHGLYVELKRIDMNEKSVSKDQKDIHSVLLDKGYQVKVCYGAAHAYKEILSYLNVLDHN